MYGNLLQTYLRDIRGSIANHHNKTDIARSEFNEFFGFPRHLRVTIYILVLS